MRRKMRKTRRQRRPFFEPQKLSGCELEYFGKDCGRSTLAGKVNLLMFLDVIYLFDDTILPKVYRIIFGMCSGICPGCLPCLCCQNY